MVIFKSAGKILAEYSFPGIFFAVSFINLTDLIAHHKIIAVLIARLFLGFLFFFQGYDAIFNIKIRNVVNTYQSFFQSKGIPRNVTVAGAWFTSIIELAGGFFLIIGLFKYIALYLLGADLIVVSIAFGITRPMWDMRYVFPRLILLLFLLLVPRALDLFSLDNFVFF
jgi:uncharacterized membrane protein YphA (DoxX/SURF4 family)